MNNPVHASSCTACRILDVLALISMRRDAQHVHVQHLSVHQALNAYALMLCTSECHTGNGVRSIVHHQLMMFMLLFQGISVIKPVCTIGWSSDWRAGVRSILSSTDDLQQSKVSVISPMVYSKCQLSMHYRLAHMRKWAHMLCFQCT